VPIQTLERFLISGNLFISQHQGPVLKKSKLW